MKLRREIAMEWIMGSRTKIFSRNISKISIFARNVTFIWLKLRQRISKLQIKKLVLLFYPESCCFEWKLIDLHNDHWCPTTNSYKRFECRSPPKYDQKWVFAQQIEYCKNCSITNRTDAGLSDKNRLTVMHINILQQQVDFGLSKTQVRMPKKPRHTKYWNERYSVFR